MAQPDPQKSGEKLAFIGGWGPPISPETGSIHKHGTT